MQGIDAIPDATFGKFLAETGVVSADDIEEASQSMVLFGGRLGTSLIEAGILTVAETEVQLAAYYGLQPVPDEWLEHPDPGARGALPAELIHRHSAYPLWFEKRTLHIGFIDPRDEAAIDEISFASGCRVVRYVLPECRFAWLMEKGFGIKPNLRFSNLMLEAETSRERRANPRVAAPAPEPERQHFDVEPLAAELDLTEEYVERPVEPATEPTSPLEAKTETDLSSRAVAPVANAAPSSRDESWEFSKHTEAAPPAPRPGPAEISRLERVLLEAQRREDVIRAAVQIASGYAEFAGLFVVRADMATGACAWREGDWLDIESIAIPTLHGNVLAEAANENRCVRTKPETQLDRKLADAIGGEAVQELAAIPISLGGRVVNLLLVDGATVPISQFAMKALCELAPMVAAAYERLILARKQLATGGA